MLKGGVYCLRLVSASTMQEISKIVRATTLILGKPTLILGKPIGDEEIITFEGIPPNITRVVEHCSSVGRVLESWTRGHRL